MTYEYLVFDLDGTLSDPKAGIVRSTNYALTAFGYAPISADRVDAYIGPPLDFAFRQITGSKDEMHIQALIAKYRQKYARSGYAENILYPGIKSMLQALQTRDAKLAVCTSKRVDFAESILKLFGIRHYFEFVDGGDVGIPKWRQLRDLRARQRLPEKALMIGDRNVDLSAAHRNGLAAAGVLWGYGSREELISENPEYLFAEPDQILETSHSNTYHYKKGPVHMSQTAFQDTYPEDVSHCYGCGRLNEHGLQLKSYWDGDESVAVVTPQPFHTAIPGFVYGGLLASIIDCHGTGTASAAAYRSEKREMGTLPALRFVTASLHVDFLRPTPIDGPLEARGRVKEVKPRKVVVSIEVRAGGKVCARGEVVAVLMPENMLPK